MRPPKYYKREHLKALEKSKNTLKQNNAYTNVGGLGGIHPRLYAAYVCFICLLVHERSFLVSRARPHLPQETGVPERVGLNDKRVRWYLNLIRCKSYIM